MKIRGNLLLKKIDRYAGIPILFFFGLFRKRRKLPETTNNIGILLTPAIGDTILTQALLRDIKTLHPAAGIILFAPAPVMAVARLIGFSNEIREISFTRILSSVKTIRGQHCDILIDTGQWSRLSAIIASFSGSAHVRGFSTPGQYRHFAFDSYAAHSNNVHEIKNLRSLYWGTPLKPGNKPLIQLEKAPRPNIRRVVIHVKPGGARAYMKEWDTANWVAIVNFLVQASLEIYFTGSVNDFQAIDEIISRIPEGKLVNLCGISIDETAALLKSAFLVISVNTGIMHLASALECNLIALHGPTDSKRWGPFNKNAIAIQSTYECAPCLNLGFEYKCNDKTGQCMRAITPQQVIEAIGKFVGKPLDEAKPLRF